MTITEADLFEAILREGELPDYDPALHLHPEIAAQRWGMKSAKAAAQRLARDKRLRRIRVRNPETNRPIDVFVPAG